MSSSDCAIVTGGASGIGKALVNCLVQRGVKVVIADISAGPGKEFEAELNKDGKRAKFVECNVTIEEHLKNVFEAATKEFGGANIVLNNAGIAGKETLGGSLDYIDNLVQINLVSVIKGTSLAIQHFRGQNCQEKKRDFSIINTGSIFGLRPGSSIPVYSLTKTAVVSFSQTLRHLADEGIRVNCIAPCFIDTNLMKDVQKTSVDALVQSRGGYMDVSHVEKAVCHLLDNKDLAGEVYEVDPAHEGLIPKPN